MTTNLKVKIGDLNLKNPVMTASGTFGYAREFEKFVDLKKLGAIITKTITLKPRQGNPPPRIIETASGMLNAIGLQNEGLENFLEDKMPYLRKIGVPIIVSIGGDTIKEYIELAEILNKIREVSAVELNISCPNVKSKVLSPKSSVRNRRQTTEDRRLISQDPKATYNLVNAVRKITRKTLITKLSPNVTDITEIAKAAQDAGSDAVSLVNTFLGMTIDINKKCSKIGNLTGGLSGSAIKPIALRMVWQVAKSVKIPVIGMGGIMTAGDALEFIIAGASAICVGTANLVDPSVSIKIINGIEDYLSKNKIRDIKELIGCLKTQ